MDTLLYQAQIDLLKAENTQLRAALRVLVAGKPKGMSPYAEFLQVLDEMDLSAAGLTEMPEEE